MLITFHCTKCQAELEGDASMTGSDVKCPQCGEGLKVPSQSLGPGLTVGGFEIIRMLGEGGMGEVYLAKQLSMGRNVALKILPAQMKVHRGAAERFFKEVKLLARLDHANIVVAFEAGEDAGVLYLAMGYVDGESLEQKLQREGPMNEDEALQMISKLAGALDHAWSKHKLFHRDIKPSNVMLTTDGELKLMDFGLAKCMQEDKVLTLSGSVMGTPNYMSPEQVDGIMELDFRADLYSLGATLYHMVTGKLPFAGSSVMETLRKQVSEALPDPRTINPAISENCVTLIEIMLSKNRDLRQADYKKLKEDIDLVRVGQPPVRAPLQAGQSVMLRAEDLGVARAPKPKLAKHRKAPDGSNRKLIIGAAGAALALVVGLVLIMGMRAPKQGTAKSEGSEKGSAVPADQVNNQSPVALKPATEETIKAALDNLEKANGGKLVSKYKITRDGITLDLNRNSKLRDLGALSGLPLVKLDMIYTGVKDLGPLVGMPLGYLNISYTPIDNIRPLSKIKTLKILIISNTEIDDLSLLKGLQLTELSCMSSKGIRDLTPLAGMPITYLDVKFSDSTSPNEMAANIAVMKDMPLGKLILTGSVIKDIKFLENFLSLPRLCLYPTQVSDLSPLRGMKSLSVLRLQENKKVTDIKALKGMDLTMVQMVGMDITSLEPLAEKGEKIVHLMIVSCPKLTDTDKIPEYFPNLGYIVIDPAFPRPEILTQCANLKQISLREGEVPITMDEFKKRFGKPVNQPITK